MTAAVDDAEPRALGDYLVNATLFLSLLILDDTGQSTLGACEIETTLVQNDFGQATPGELGAIQHQGVARLGVRNGTTPTGQPRPILTVPALPAGARAQVAALVYPATLGTNLGEISVHLCFEAPDASEQLGLEFLLDANTQSTIVAIPPQIDWKHLRAYNHTEEIGDAEFFDPAQGPTIPATGDAWANAPDLSWDDLPEGLTWADADAILAS